MTNPTKSTEINQTEEAGEVLPPGDSKMWRKNTNHAAARTQHNYVE